MGLYPGREEEDEDRDDSLDGAGTVEAVANELFKSYGFGRNADGSWDWSVDRIQRAFKDSPIWTTLDYVSVAVPILKWGKALSAVGKVGKAGLVGEAFRAGEFAGQKAEGLAGRFAGAVFGDERAAAAQSYLRGPQEPALEKLVPQRFKPAVTRFAQRFQSPASMQLDERFGQWADRWGTETWEGRAVASSAKREMVLEQASAKRMAEEGILDFTRSKGTPEAEAAVRAGVERGGGTYSPERFQKARMQRAEQLFRQGVGPDDKLVGKLFERDEAGMRAYQNRWSYMHGMHEDAFDLNVIGEAAYEKGLQKGTMYAPRIYEAWTQIRAATRLLDPDAAKAAREITKSTDAAIAARRAEAVTARTRAAEAATKEGLPEWRVKERADAAHEAVLGMRHKTPAGVGRENFLKKSDEALFDEILDPRASFQRMAQAKQVIARQRYLQNIASSSIAVKGDAMVAHVQRVMGSGNEKWMKLWGVSGVKRDAIETIMRNEPLVGREATGQALGKMLGWKPMDELLAEAGIPGYVDSLPEAMRGVWIDPTVAKDVAGSMKQLAEPEWYAKLYKGILNTFQAVKAPYNPATHVRDFLGSYVSFANVTGKVPKGILPQRAFKAMWERTPELFEAIDSGVLGNSFNREIRDGLRAAFGGANPDEKLLGATTALDWMGEGGVATSLQKVGGFGEKVYRAKDDLWRLEAWMERVDHHTARYEALGRDVLEGNVRAARKGAQGAVTDGQVASWVRARAKENALVDVMRRMPQNQIHSEVADLLRSAIPFSSFTSEAIRTGKNTAIEAPHMVFFWNHVFETLSEMGGMVGGFSPEELEAAKQNLPEYTQGKKMVVIPFNVDGAPRFLDVSYLLPLGNVGGMEQGQRLFFRELYDPTTNPLLNVSAAVATGKDPFTGRDIAPNVTERQLGIPVTGAARPLVGLAEHMAAMMLPPLVAPGYAGVNLIEAARGQINPATGERIEDGVLTSVLRNVFGFRTYQADVASQVLNVRKEQGRAREAISQSWARWDFARANGDEEAMQREQGRIVELRDQEGDEHPEKYFAEAAKKRQPFSNLTTDQLKDILHRAQSVGRLSPSDEKARQLLEQRLRKRQE